MEGTPNYIKALVKPNGKGNGRRVWSVDLESVWLPFFMATNVMGDTVIPNEALGAPLRLAYTPDGAVRFSKSGRPVIKVAKDISDGVRLVRENFIGGLQTYASTVQAENAEAYQAQVMKARDAGKPVLAHDKAKLDEALAKAMAEAIAEAEGQERTGGELAESRTDTEAAASGELAESKAEKVAVPA